MTTLPKPCLMLITEPSPRLPQIVAEAIEGGVNVVLWREKRGVGMGYNRAYNDLMAVTKENVSLIVDGDWQRAQRLHVRCIHLPEKSMPIGVIRHHLGARTLVGKTIRSVQAALAAAEQGADYIIAGPVFESSSEDNSEALGLDFLKEICSAVSIPVVANGGITPENTAACIESGAAGIAIQSGVMRSDSHKEAALSYKRAIGSLFE